MAGKYSRINILICTAAMVILTGCGGFLDKAGDIYSSFAGETTITEVDNDTAGSSAEPAEAVAEEETEREPIESVSEERYVYGTLSGEVKAVYDEIVHVLLEHDESIIVSTLDIDTLDKAYKSVCADYGEIFWASGYVYTSYTRGDELVEIEFAPQYTMDEDEREETQELIDEKVDSILDEMQPSDLADDYSKVKFVFDYLAGNVAYDTDAPDNQNMISTFLLGRTVCQGYACGTQYMLRKLGIQSAIVSGTAKGESHAWNLVMMDGDYYYVDTTWGNSSYTGGDSSSSAFINYNYLGVTSQEMNVTHTSNNNFALPDCTATADNYYIREGRYFTEWDPERLGSLINSAYTSGAMLSVRFASADLYQTAYSYLIDDGKIVNYCSGITSLTYVEDHEQNVITFLF